MASSWTHAKQVMCVFDLLGTSGDVYAEMRDYALAARNWGADITLKSYSDERVAAEDFKAGQCDGVAVTGMRGRQFNSFTGSVDSIGSLPSYSLARSVMQLIARPQLAPDMVQGNYEVVGVTPMGAAYLFVNDRELNSLTKASGKKVAVLSYDKAQALLVQRAGAQPVMADITTFGGLFNNGQVDVIGAPAVAFKPLELYKGLGSKGAIVKFPVLQVTGNLIIHKNKFPAGFGQKSREWVASRIPRAIATIERLEKEIPDRYWMEISANDQVGYIKLMREARIQLTKEGIYHPKMMSLMKKVRCVQLPSSFECELKDE
ncbi:MAG: putative solute-binding protein [Moraxellaceae bacterium]